MSATLCLPSHDISPFQPLFTTQHEPEPDRPMSPQDIKHWCLARADEWYAQGERAAARDLLKHVVMLDPEDVQARIALGTLHYELGEFEPAGLTFNIAGELDPMNPQVFMQLGLTHQKLGQDELAEALLNHALALEPENQLALGLLSAFLMQAGRFAEARVHLAYALSQQPENVTTLLRLGLCCFKTESFDTARNCYERVLQLSPGNALAQENLDALTTFATAAACLN